MRVGDTDARKRRKSRVSVPQMRSGRFRRLPINRHEAKLRHRHFTIPMYVSVYNYANKRSSAPSVYGHLFEVSIILLGSISPNGIA